jgi:hypothetical protein
VVISSYQAKYPGSLAKSASPFAPARCEGAAQR